MYGDGTFVSPGGSAGRPLMKMVIPPRGGDETGYSNFLSAWNM